MENVKKWYEHWQLWLAILTSIGGVVGYIYTKGQESKKLEGRTFDTPEQKVEHIFHVKATGSPDKLREKAIFDSIQIVEIKNLLIKNAKADEDIKKHIHNIDSINLLNAVQNDVIKKKLEKLDH